MQRRHLTRFILTGLAASATHYIVLYCCADMLQMDPVLATLPAFSLAFILSYGLNRNWTFASAERHRRAIPAYLALALLGLGNNALLMQIIVHELQRSYTLGFLAGLLTTPILSYLGSRYLIFRPATTPE